MSCANRFTQWLGLNKQGYFLVLFYSIRRVYDSQNHLDKTLVKT